MAKIQDIDIPYLEFAEAAAPGTPAAAVSRIYVKADGLFYSKDDAGVETLMSAGSVTRASLGLATTDSPQFAAVNVGAATDTTLARVSAGVLSVEGNTLYAAGGTDVPVADGGTGASTAAGARTNLGLIIGTDVAAPIVSVAADCSADVDLAADTLTDITGCSISLVAGTWEVFAIITYTANTGYALHQITDAANAIFAEGRGAPLAASETTWPASCRVTPGSTTTYKLRAQTNGATNVKKFGASDAVGTRIWALKVA